MSLLSYFAPQFALKRQIARTQLKVIERSFQAGVDDRLSGWRRRAQETLQQKAKRDLATTRTQARELYRNNPYARGAVNSIVANLVGCGIRPQARVIRPRLLEPMENFNDRADTAWAKWAAQEDFYGKQRLVQREKIVAGECLVRLSNPRGREIPLAIDVIAAERLWSMDRGFGQPPAAAGNLILQGVEMNAAGRPVAYWIHPFPPGDQPQNQNDAERVPAEEILHIADRLEPGQIRGFTRFLTCAGTFEAMAQYMDFVLTKERVASAFALVFERQNAINFITPADGGPTEDEQGNVLDYVEGGMMYHAHPGEKVNGISSGLQSQQVEQLMTVLLRQVARGLDVSYELVSRDLSKVTYLSARQGENQDRRHWEPQQEDLNRDFNIPIWRKFIEAGWLGGLWKFEPAQLDSFSAVDFIPEGWDWIDPQKDVAGDLEAMKAGIRSPIEVIAKGGGDAWKTLNEISQFKKWAAELDLSLSIFQDQVAEAEAAAQPEPAPVETPNEQTNGDAEEDSSEAA